VGTATGLIHIYDITSHQLLRTISTHKGMSISHLATMLKPPDLVGHISLSLNIGSSADAKDIIPMRPVVPFHRMKDSKAREAHEVAMILPVQDEVNCSLLSLLVLILAS
jgi:pre-rRNA-processing protein IPI3